MKTQSPWSTLVDTGAYVSLPLGAVGGSIGLGLGDGRDQVLFAGEVDPAEHELFLGVVPKGLGVLALSEGSFTTRPVAERNEKVSELVLQATLVAELLEELPLLEIPGEDATLEVAEPVVAGIILPSLEGTEHPAPLLALTGLRDQGVEPSSGDRPHRDLAVVPTKLDVQLTFAHDILLGATP